MKARKNAMNIWIGLRASDYQMFGMPIRMDKIASIDFETVKGVRLISCEMSTKERSPWSNEELLEIEKLRNFRNMISKLGSSGKHVNIFCYHSIPTIEKIAEKNKQIKIYAPPISIKRKFDDKLFFLKLLKNLEIKSAYSLIGEAKEKNYCKFKRELGRLFVAKKRIGASGGATHLIKNKRDFLKLAKNNKKETLIFSKYISGPSLNVNAFAGKKISVSCPSLQIIGAPECSSGIFAYCGNDFAATRRMSRDIGKELHCITRKIGEAMKKRGYWGIFGIDFVYDIKNKVLFPLEINPRFQGSTPLLMRYLRSKNISGLVELYINSSKLISGSERRTVNASFLLLHNINGKKMTVKRHLKSGIYKFYFRNRKMSLYYIGNDMLFPGSNDELLILGCPQAGVTIKPGAGILRIEFAGQIMNSKLTALKKRYSCLAKEIYKLIWK
jgi:hypothetical protein